MDFPEETSRLRLVINWIVDIIVVICAAWFVVFALGTQLIVSGQSMEPALHSGEAVLMNRLVYRIGSPHRYDIAVFRREDGTYNMKRVIGLPGETVQIKDGLVFIDGEVPEGPERFTACELAGLAENPVVLAEDEYFLLGDSRETSEDSRFVHVGNVKKEDMIGKIWLRIRPVKRFGLIHS